jgi:predicted alpha/beta superfamily hydrolase
MVKRKQLPLRPIDTKVHKYLIYNDMHFVSLCTILKETSLTVIILLLFTFNIIAQKADTFVNIRFVLTSPSLSNDSSVFICGSIPELSDWNPSALKMKNTGDHTWTITIKTEISGPIGYKYTLGSWEKEGTGSDGQPLQNFIIKVISDTTITDNVPSWLEGTRRKLYGKITGTVKYHPQMAGKGIPSRDIIVWLPPDYGVNKNIKYPVLYMQDGQNLFDPLTSSFGVDWQADETCDSLIRNMIIDPLIVVGIYNTKERMTEYVPGTAGTAYMNFVVNVVKPFIDRNYLTLSGKKNTFVGGSSAGGTIAFLIAWNNPSIFSKVLCMSPAFKIQNIDVVKNVSEYSGKKKKLVFYIDNGGKGLEERLQPGIDEMIKALENKGYLKNKDFFWIKSPDAEHNEAAWAKRLKGALKLILPGRK